VGSPPANNLNLNKMTLAELQSKINWQAPKNETNVASAQLGELFTNCNIGIIKNSKNNAERASLILQNKETGKSTIVVCSLDITPFVRNGQITAEHLKGMPVVFNEKYESFFIGEGFKFEDLDALKIKAFNRIEVITNPEELAGL
jgi:hypothetical protein